MGSHVKACKMCSTALRKAMAESSLAAGGAAVPPEPETKSADVSEVVTRAFGSLDESLFRLTGKRVG